MLLGVPYGEPQTPFWGSPKSRMNFCEEDYIVTKYLAEFFNTVTSFAYIGYGLHGIWRGSSRSSISNVPYIGLIAVGIASGVYHASLQYHTAMGDEMSMHFAMGCVLVRIFTFQQPLDIARRNAAVIIIGLTVFIAYHCITDEFVMHVIVFLSLCITVIWKTRTIIRARITDPAQSDKMASLATFGTCCAGLAYFLWNIDVHLCGYVTTAKRQLGLPLGALLELHGYWHILTAISSYTFMAMIEFLTEEERDGNHGIGFFWPARSVLEDMVSSEKAKGAAPNGKVTANGSTKKEA